MHIENNKVCLCGEREREREAKGEREIETQYRKFADMAMENDYIKPTGEAR